MKRTVKVFIVILIATFLLWGHLSKRQVVAEYKPLFSSTEVETNQVKIMQTTCAESYKVDSGELERKCGQLIDSLQCKGFEVLSDNQGYFWAEPNKEMKCERNS